MPVFARMFELDFMKETVLCDHEIMCDLRPDVAEGNALTEMIRMAHFRSIPQTSSHT